METQKDFPVQPVETLMLLYIDFFKNRNNFPFC